ncbi:MAG: ABC transporter permease [Chloroflexi bacterium]|nr:ABC transporter permease [Chloroflexota bacterium]
MVDWGAMWNFVLKRLLISVPLLIGITVIAFFLFQASGDPLAFYSAETNISAEARQAILQKYSLDQPVYIQYLHWAANLLQGNWGYSFITHQPVLEMILERLPNTIILSGTALLLGIGVALPMGILSALRQYSIVDYFVTFISFIGFSMPTFWLGLMLLLLFGVTLKWFPMGGMYPATEGPSITGVVYHLVLPASALVLVSLAHYVRYLRGSMLEVLSQEYIRTAHSKGLAQRSVVLAHALKNAAIPLVTVVALDIPFIISGAIVVETIFSWPGMGRLFWEEAQRQDYPVLMGVLVLSSTLVIFSNLLADIAYGFLDPRIRYD